MQWKSQFHARPRWCASHPKRRTDSARTLMHVAQSLTFRRLRRKTPTIVAHGKMKIAGILTCADSDVSSGRMLQRISQRLLHDPKQLQKQLATKALYRVDIQLPVNLRLHRR